MDILHDQSDLRRAASALDYIESHGLLGDLKEWLGYSVRPHDSHRSWRIEHGRPASIASLLCKLTQSDYELCHAATVAELEPIGIEDRCEQICEFARLHQKHGDKF